MLKYTYRKHPQLMPLISPHKNQEETLASCKAFAMSYLTGLERAQISEEEIAVFGSQEGVWECEQ